MTDIAPAVAPAPAAPTTARQRHHLVDALRGAALLGIVVVNMEYLLQPIDVGWVNADSTADSFVRWFVASFAMAKVYPIFALLFGYGLTLQMRSRAGDAELRARMQRRFLALGLMGIVHGVLFFPGDILLIYAIIGAAMFRCRDWSAGRLMRLAAWVYGIAIVGWFLVGLLDLATWSDSGPAIADAGLSGALLGSSFMDIVTEQGSTWIVTFLILSVAQGPAVVACFAAGIALGRTTWLSDPDSQKDRVHRILTRLAPAAFLIAALAGLLVVSDGRWSTLGFALSFAIAPAIAVSYIALLAWASWSAPAVIDMLRRSGRMSLTVYLGQSFLAAVWAHGWGFGQLGQGGPLSDVIVGVAIWAVLSAAATLWMGRFRFGPLEHLLRMFSYARRSV